MTIGVAPVTGAGLAEVIPALARLRIAVFCDFPYLYDGDAAYEASYLADFAAADGSVIVVARDGAEIIGAATA
ncbi:MAG: GNAT family N-acetyltransferase, partial [Sphingopyxis sp.]|nr:GNAT family N-acetyltransferase [Sphingopyxis sp.]